MRIWIIVIVAALLPCVLSAQIVWEEHTLNSEFDAGCSVYAIDLDGDGDCDVLGAAFNIDDIKWWENVDGDGSNWAEHTVDGSFNGVRSVYAADVDGDGDTDVLGAAGVANDIKWWENVNGDGLNWAEHMVTGNFSYAISVYATDIDGDGDIDVLGAANYTHDITWWENVDGDGLNWLEHSVDDAFAGACWVFATDVDGDGDIDVLGAGAIADDIMWWENVTGDGLIWSEHTVDGAFNSANSVYATDMDDDGDIDILGGGQEIAWWENMDGIGLTWSEHTVDSDFSGRVYATDVDDDNDIDVLGAAGVADEITWWENVDGSGHIWYEHVIDSEFLGAESVYATDVDGDGDTDVLGAAVESDHITWWENIQSYVTIELGPLGVPIVIPEQGGQFDFEVRISNTSDDIIWFTAWTEAMLPSGNLYSPIQLYSFIAIGAYSEIVSVVTQNVPSFAPTGEYQYIACVGTFPAQSMFLDSFSFTKTGWTSGNSTAVNSWALTGWNDDDNDTRDPVLPTEYRVEPAYPNPFNPSTQIMVELPSASLLEMSVYNIRGQHIATLADGVHLAGKYLLTFDGLSLASGVYFVNTVVSGRLDSMQKVVLVK
jgi:FG-GAP-like repeat